MGQGEGSPCESAAFLKIDQRGGGRGVTPMFKNFVANFCTIIKAAWQHRIHIKRLLIREEMSQIEGKIV